MIGQQVINVSALGYLSFRSTTMNYEGMYTLALSNKYGSINESLLLTFNHPVSIMGRPPLMPPIYRPKPNPWSTMVTTECHEIAYLSKCNVIQAN